MLAIKIEFQFNLYEYEMMFFGYEFTIVICLLSNQIGISKHINTPIKADIMKEQLFYILEKLVVKNNIRLHKEELQLQLMSHPSYPSLHSVTGVLDHFKINNLALRVPTTQDVLEQLPEVFMANVKIDHEDEVVLVRKRKNGLKIIVDAKKTMIWKREEFLLKWNGVIIAIEKDENVEEYSGRSTTWVNTGLLLAFGIAAAAGFVYMNQQVFPIGHFILSILGFILSVFIIKHKLGIKSSTASKFCNLLPSTSCDALISSKGARILGAIKLSDLSITVFSGYILAWLIFTVVGIENNSLFIGFSILAIPFTIFSIYYQYNVAKKWCPLCLGVVCVLLLQFAMFLIGDTSVSSISFIWQEALLFLASFILAMAGWSLTKNFLAKKINLENTQVAHYKFKRKYSIFKALYEQGKAVDTSENLSGEITLGNDNAPIKLTLVTSPYCIYCRDAHKDIKALLKNKNINVTLRFLVGSSDKENDFYKIISELLHTYHTHGKTATLVLLDQLYEEGINLSEWVQDQNIHYNPGYDKIMDWQLQWCTDNGIGFTPALYVFDKPFPDDYDRKDLLLFTDDIVDNLSHLSIETHEDRKVS